MKLPTTYELNSLTTQNRVEETDRIVRLYRWTVCSELTIEVHLSGVFRLEAQHNALALSLALSRGSPTLMYSESRYPRAQAEAGWLHMLTHASICSLSTASSFLLFAFPILCNSLHRGRSASQIKEGKRFLRQQKI